MCRPICWLIAAFIGIVVGVISGLSIIWAIIAAILVFVFLGWLLTRWVCGGDEISAAAAPAPMAAPKPAPAPAPAAAPSAAPAAAAATAAPAEPAVAPAVAEPTPDPAPVEKAPAEQAAPAPAAGSSAHWSAAVAADSGKTGDARGQTGLKPTAELAEEATVRDGVGSWKYESDAKPYRSEGGAPSAPEPAAPAPAPEAAQTPAPESPIDPIYGATTEAEPEILSAARGGVADDLKRIKGVGPGLEKTLNELGFYHFDQIAAWGDAEVAWVDARLKFKGRITRDNWIDQAKEFAKG